MPARCSADAVGTDCDETVGVPLLPLTVIDHYYERLAEQRYLHKTIHELFNQICGTKSEAAAVVAGTEQQHSHRWSLCRRICCLGGWHNVTGTRQRFGWPGKSWPSNALLGLSEHALFLSSMRPNALFLDLSTGQLFFTDYKFDLSKKVCETIAGKLPFNMRKRVHLQNLAAEISKNLFDDRWATMAAKAEQHQQQQYNNNNQHYQYQQNGTNNGRQQQQKVHRSHSAKPLSAAELLQDNDVVLTVMLHNYAHQYIDSMLTLYIAKAKAHRNALRKCRTVRPRNGGLLPLDRTPEEQRELQRKRTQKRRVEDQFFICNLPADIQRVHSPGFCGVLCTHPKHVDVLDVRKSMFAFVESMKGTSGKHWHILTPKRKRNFEAGIGTIPTFLQPGGKTVTTVALGKYCQGNPEPVALRPNYWLETSREQKPGLGYIQESRWKVKVRVPKYHLADLLLEQFSTPEEVQRMAQGYESVEWEAAEMVEHEFVEPDSAVNTRRKRALDAARKIVCVEKGGMGWKVVEEGKEESEEEEEKQQQKKDDGWAVQERDENGWATENRAWEQQQAVLGKVLIWRDYFCNGTNSTSTFVYAAGQQITQDGSLRSRMAKFLMRHNQSWGSGGDFDREVRDAHGKKRTYMSRKQVVCKLERRFDNGMERLCREFNSIGTEVNYRQLAAYYNDVVSMGAALSSASWPEQTDRAELVKQFGKREAIRDTVDELKYWFAEFLSTCYEEDQVLRQRVLEENEEDEEEAIAGI